MEVFIIAHVNYDYEELCSEVEGIYRDINEPLDDFYERVMQIYFRFPKSEKASNQEVFH
jgi:hypothetical protein